METAPLKQYSQKEIEQSLYEVRQKIYPRQPSGMGGWHHCLTGTGAGTGADAHVHLPAS
jgi:hypothetical protein